MSEVGADRRERQLELRPYRPEHRAAVAHLFWDTFLLGRPLPFALAGADAYEELALGYFLGPGADGAAVLVNGDDVAGYVLATADLDGLDAFVRRASVSYLGAVAAAAVRMRLDRRSARFHWLRTVDGLAMLRRSPPPPLPVVAHVNIARGNRFFPAGRIMTDHIDGVCRREGAPGWYGEINAPVGRRSLALRWLGGEIGHRAPNRTFSWLAETPVERLTVIRLLDEVVAGLSPTPAAR